MNTVPGKCTMYLDLRSTDKQSKDRAKVVLQEKLDKICADHQVTYTKKVLTEDDPKTFSKSIMSISENVCQEMGVKYMILPSRAGHDACNMANIIKDVGMIFVPSKDGVSHHHDEWTDIDEIVLGAKILLLTLFELATKERP